MAITRFNSSFCFSKIFSRKRSTRPLVYIVIPISLLLTVIRLIQDTIKLAKESEENLGASKPSMDLDACEREWNAKKAAMNEKGGTK